MGEIRAFAPRLAANMDEAAPSLTGPARCISCGHEWQAVTVRGAPHVNCDGAPGLECPQCKSEKGVLTQFVQYTDVTSWHCNFCRSYLFSIILAKDDTVCLACACCGELTNGLDIFNK